MKGTKAASRYAQALLDLSIEQNQLEQVYADMITFAQAVKETKEFQLFLNNPVINSSKKKDVLTAVFPDFAQLTSSFIALVTANRRENLLPFIAASFIEQYKAHKGIVEVTVLTASRLDDTVREQILAKIKPSIKVDIELREEIDPELIGGFVVEMGDVRIDASVSSQLNNLKQRLTR